MPEQAFVSRRTAGWGRKLREAVIELLIDRVGLQAARVRSNARVPRVAPLRRLAPPQEASGKAADEGRLAGAVHGI